ncbi:30S ribosomal protein S9 [Candidatus Uhrbacteria bacterium RIFCSPLOWO2_01_FULL_53_9]|uniref:Small ribosomal subunit protein uS9 n=3 Tax=Candidatus Uhriibacteriota TaxID=1752732 RepID=A0A1F7UWP2_9BACT|nr:MAG: 30S ribosomal protein S9 [Candidatus Uhrbacteria bacterium RIFCSPHIGHO2_02_FULL_53_13]OGL82695.1 MAG: 30S ribosomal protein S9 [Candidatus Uhrbacteria bacterium RIFCSPLOWO2_01_FULL_53_9]OGL89172.1 MAG: 30S ribosomal protein S9 [Candidatus Uhrbacteria bacterium RIFCSPLOWO2_02_FULL_53_10]
MKNDNVTFEGKYVSAVGRRKTSVAQARVYTRGTGKVVVNGRPVDVYFPTLLRRQTVMGPLEKTGMSVSADVSVKVLGGGETGQADATQLAIARALVKIDETLRSSLKSEGYLSRDARKVERKKPGLRKARRAPQWSKR